ncbi:MAG: ABC transporter ATP-binding protein [Desulfobacterales bacterium]
MGFLDLSNVEIKYKGIILVVRGVSISIPEEGIVAILGANGAGKTTILKGISGLLKTEEGEVTDGRIEFLGARIDRTYAEDIFDLGVVQVMEGRRIFPYLTTEENLSVGAKKTSDIDNRLELVYDYFPQLKKLKKRLSGYLSGGEQQMLVIGRALMSDPKLLLLDEPTMGLSPLLTSEIFHIIKRINKEQKTSILLVEQNAAGALSVCDYGYILESGRIVLEGSADELKENPDIKEFYLGMSSLGEKKNFREIKHYKRRKRWLG